MSEIFDEAARIAREAVPKVLCGAGGLSRLGQDIAGKVNPFYDGSLLDGYQTAVTGALQGFCDVPPAGPIPTPELPFTGGQCSAMYTVSFQYKGIGRFSCFLFGSTFNSAPVQGPITSIRLGGQQQTTTCQPGPIFKQVVASIPGNPAANLIQLGGNDFFYEVSNISVTRVGGLPDNCGNPPPVFPPGTPNPNPPTPPPTEVVINLPDIGPVTVTFSPTVGIAYVDADAEFNVPVTVNVDVGGIDVNFDVDFDVNISDPTKPPKPTPPNRPRKPDGRVEPPDCPPPSECINEPEEDEPSTEPPPVDPKEFVVTGAAALCVVDISESTATEILQENGPNIWVPRLGYIRFQYVTNRGETVWGTDIAVKGTNFVAGAPDVGLKCVGAVLNTERGVAGELVLLTKKRTAGCC